MCNLIAVLPPTGDAYLGKTWKQPSFSSGTRYFQFYHSIIYVGNSNAWILKVSSHLHHQKHELLSKTLKAVPGGQTTSFGAI